MSTSVFQAVWSWLKHRRHQSDKLAKILEKMCERNLKIKETYQSFPPGAFLPNRTNSVLILLQDNKEVFRT